MTPSCDASTVLRKSVYAILIAASTGILLGRICAVDEVDVARLDAERIRSRLAERLADLRSQGLSQAEIAARAPKLEQELRERLNLRRPWLSANDRSRWCTLRALVEPDMRVIREVERNGRVERVYVWYAIDKVQNQRGWDTIDMVKHTLRDDPDGPAYLYSSKPPLLPTLMAVPYWALYQTTGWSLGEHPYLVGRILLVVLNVIPTVVLLLLVARMAERYGATDWGRIFVVAAACFGTFLTTFGVTLNNHLPGALSALIAFYAALRIWVDGERRLRYFALAGFFAAFSVACELPAAAFFGLLGIALLFKAPRPTLVAGVPAAVFVVAALIVTNWIAHQDIWPAYAHRGDGANWYDYTYERDGRTLNSYWNNRVGIDRGEPTRAMYFVHTTVGHHGVFLLTPIWILAFVGLGMWSRQADRAGLRQAAWFVLFLSLFVFVFYMTRGQDDRNYGGMSCCFRWMLWFAPLWLFGMLPAVDRMSQSRALRGTALALLAASAMSAAYPIWNPWSLPWAYHFMLYLGWISGF